MSLSDSASDHIVYKTVFAIETSSSNGEKIMDRCSCVFNKKLKGIITENIIGLALNSKGKLSLEKVIVDLGNIELDWLETEMPKKLATELRNALSQYYHSSEDITRTERASYPQSIWKEAYPHRDNIKGEKKLSEDIFNQQSAMVSTRNAFAGTQLVEKVDYYLHKGYWSSEDRTNTVYIDNNLCQQINHQPQQWLPMLARHCLQTAGLNRLIQISQPEVLRLLCQLFIEITTQKLAGSVWQVTSDIKVTPERLKAAAEYYLQHQMTYVSAAQQARTELQVQNDLTPVKNITENGSNSFKPDISEVNALIDDAENPDIGEVNTLIKEVGERRYIQPGSAIPTPSAQSVLSVSNAGCMILWPLLPTFFTTFGLLDKNKFISLEAQREAVCLLDWLIWAEDEIPAWRLTLNKVICGLPVNDNALWRVPEPEQQTIISQWLEKIIMQLPAWKKMGASDVRYLFLQRSGELSGLESGIKIHVKPEIYDALLTDWPWPMNMACFSWLNQPLTITWL
ncbi:hypothetical protein Ppb6_02225 [Photorhabdus australis subsp. thailandensis]|uniref:Uncharacterized protein n=1 Tax=Photorhabdus australis subsp. thailandensis TaxID=2805096 RepID=A0A1C0U3H2_9GAMM|nr:contractile injection system tape measure protein [Photorhabdus australis]OCQ52489.1 hypothetical protein Ppb6_02225 [Photorhabdus australis subsp. thailandensis]